VPTRGFGVAGSLVLFWGVVGAVEPGDLIRWRDQVWLVRRVEPDLATAIVESTDRQTETLPSDADSSGACELWCRPANDWPSAPLPFKKQSCLVGVRFRTTDLVRLQDWVKLDDFQIGGALYLHPRLDLQYGDRLTVIYSGPRNRQTMLPVEIPRSFSPLPRKHAAAPLPTETPARPKPKVTPALFALLKDEE